MAHTAMARPHPQLPSTSPNERLVVSRCAGTLGVRGARRRCDTRRTERVRAGKDGASAARAHVVALSTTQRGGSSPQVSNEQNGTAGSCADCARTGRKETKARTFCRHSEHDEQCSEPLATAAKMAKRRTTRPRIGKKGGGIWRALPARRQVKSCFPTNSFTTGHTGRAAGHRPSPHPNRTPRPCSSCACGRSRQRSGRTPRPPSGCT